MSVKKPRSFPRSHSAETQAVLPETLVTQILEAAALPASSNEDREAQSRARQALMRRIAGAANASTRTVRQEDAAWQRYLRGVERMVVEEGEAMHTWLLRLAPGASLPAHDHDHGDEESFILSGSCLLNGELLHAGDYHHARSGSHHEQLVSEAGCVLWLRMPAPQARFMTQPPASSPRA